MPRIKTSTIPEQVADHLREGIMSGRWVGRLPGRDVLATELGVSPRSLQKAVELLKKEGWLRSQGQGKSTKISAPKNATRSRHLRVALLLFKKQDSRDDYVIELIHQLEEAGHIPVVPNEGLRELGMNPKRLARLVKETNADAWMVASASREILQWFVDHEVKVFAFAGRRYELPIAGTGPNKLGCYQELVQQLAQLGHRRIVFLAQSQLRKPEPALFLRTFLEEMESVGIPIGPYNLPDWEESPEGLQKILDSLFKTTPPTALLIDEAHLFHAAYHFLARRNLKVPEDVSLICTDGDYGFSWCRPSVAHISWDSQPVVQRIMRWVNNVARGQDDRRQSFTKAEFVSAGTIGPPSA